MWPTEPIGTAWLLLLVGALLVVSVLSSRFAARGGLPVALLFLGVGMLAGSEGLGGIDFENYGLAFRLGTVALVLILFDGGLNTPRDSIAEGLKPAALLATAGVLATAALVAVGARALGLGWPEAALLGAVVSSTDAATVFAVLRASGVQLGRRVGATLELESGLNDPMAVILTMALTRALASGEPPGWRLAGELVLQLAVGAGLGLGFGRLGRLLLARARLRVAGLYPVLTLGLALLAFAVPTLLFGSGFLAVYLAAIVIGNGELPYRSGLLRVHDAVAWFSQVAMFLMLGLLVFPSRLLEVALPGLAVALWLAFVARPLPVLLLLAPFRFGRRELALVGWTGLRGAVPIVLATYPVLAGLPGGGRIFDLVFFVVVINALLPGATIGWVTRRLGLDTGGPPPPAAVLEINSVRPLDGEILSFWIEPALAAAGVQIADLPLPDTSVVLLIVREREIVAPRGPTVLLPGDHVYLFCRREDVDLVRLLFGRPED